MELTNESNQLHVSTIHNIPKITTHGSSNKLEKAVDRESGYREPPDGGTRAWFVMVSGFCCNGILFGIINTYGTIYLNLHKRLTDNGMTDASSKAALVGSLSVGCTFLLSPVSGILTDKIGLRKTTFIGGLLASSGLFLSSWLLDDLGALYITYGIMFGTGAALAYTPTLAIMGHYFKKYLGIVSGFVTAGSSICTIILPTLLNYLLNTCGLSITLLILSIVTLFILVSALIYKPLQPPLPVQRPKPGQSTIIVLLKSLVHVENWKKKRYIIWAISIPLALIGYFVPYVHVAKLVEDKFPGENQNLPITCIGITSVIGRLVFGFIADFKGVNRIMLQQISFLSLGLLTIFIPLTPNFTLLIIITLAMGFFDGCFISLLGPIAFDICGPRGATQGIGFLLGLCSIPLTVGPPIAGQLYDATKSYKLSFLLAGIPAVFGAATMCLIRCFKDGPDNNEVIDNELVTVPLARPAWNEESQKDVIIGSNLTSLTPEHKATLAFAESLNEIDQKN